VPQLLALVEALMTGNYPGGQRVMPAFVSGTSSGAITAATVSLLAEALETGGVNFTWHNMRRQIDKMTSAEVFDSSPEALALIPFNFLRGFILDNTPERKFLTAQTRQYNHSKFGDLYLPTYISTVNQTSGETIRLYSRDPVHSTFDLVDVIMSSTAIPLVFRPATIPEYPGIGFLDGGTAQDMIPVYTLLTQPNCTSVYALAYAGVADPNEVAPPWYLADLPLLYNAMAAFNAIRIDVATVALEQLTEVTDKPTFAYIPKLAKSWGGLDFDHGKEEYDAVRKWTSQNGPTAMNGGKNMRKQVTKKKR